MLELKNIVKDYVSGNNVTHALKGISVNFRRNEFVSILGASGCGKTTTLNIIGGLDRYTSGDLIIAGKSTKDYTDRDWDTYRNHSIGFIFQTYNLIGHQNILKNVELALTISGVSKAERKARAMEALKKVGLEGMEKKKPNQLSGGQCQRVAIARALINNPEILLADEPTGALDSETSVQIMDLLKEVASDRLVIMVTHNPDLAEKYSTRIIRMSDGKLTDDSQPFDGNETVEETVEVVSKGKKKQSSMSLTTSTGLSLANLFSKMRRTVLVTIAGSIGIIGVSAVLAVSQGVKDFIGDMQDDMLSSYPVQIAEESVDYTSLMTGLDTASAAKAFKFDPENPKIGVDSMINYLMTAYSDVTKVKTNIIDDNLLAYIDQIPEESLVVTQKDYSIDVTNNIFGLWNNEKVSSNGYTSFNGLTRSYISELETVVGFERYATFVDLFTNFMVEMPDNAEYILDQYDVIAGDPVNLGKDDLVLVVDQDTTLTDLLFAQTGMFNHDEFIDIAQCAIEENDKKKTEEYEQASKEQQQAMIDEIRSKYSFREDFTYDDVLNRDFYYFPHNTIYKDNPSIADDETVVTVSFVIVEGGIFKDFYYLTHGEMLGYEGLFGKHIYQGADGLVDESSYFIRMPSTSPTGTGKDVANGMWIEISIDDLTTVKRTLSLNSAVPAMNFIGDGIVLNPALGTPITPTIDETITPVKGYAYESVISNQGWLDNPSGYGGSKMKIKSILRLKDTKKFGCLTRGLYYSKAFADQYMNDAKDSDVVIDGIQKHMNDPLLNSTEFKAYVTYKYYDHKHSEVVNGYASSLNGTLTSSFAGLFSGISGGVDNMGQNATYLRSLSGKKTDVIYNNDDLFDHCEFGHYPEKISIYPKSFDSKDVITKHLDKWNEDVTISIQVGDETRELTKIDRPQLTYTDTIQLIVTVINTLINAITIALVVFTSLSLVVSCFMIAVITYISVVERIKEIGVIRSLGGRKRDVASLFVMENLLTGLFSGLFGVAITYVIQIVLNICLKAAFGIVIANFTIPTALIMVGVSILLSVISGFIPSQSAAHKDPVVALRTAE